MSSDQGTAVIGGVMAGSEDAGALRRRSKLRRRFLLASVALLSMLLAVLGIGFAADAGTSTVTVGSGEGVNVFPVAGPGSAPDGAVTLPKGSATGAGGTPEVQLLTPSAILTAGNFRLTFNGQTTPDIGYDANAATIDGALEGLSTIGVNNVTVAKLGVGTDAISVSVMQVTFAGALAGTNVPQITVTNNVSGGTITATTDTEGVGSDAWGTSVPPSWNVAVGTAGDVNPGDLVYIDAIPATSTKVMVSVFVTNLDKLAVNYSSWAFDLGVYQSVTGASGSWTKVADSYVTSDRGAHTFTVAIDNGGKHLAIAMDAGTFYTIQTDTSSGSLQPSFFVRATEL